MPSILCDALSVIVTVDLICHVTHPLTHVRAFVKAHR